MSHTIDVKEDTRLAGAPKSYGTLDQNTPPPPAVAGDAAGLPEKIDTANFLLNNLCCDMENRLIDRALQEAPGIVTYKSNLVSRTLCVEYFPHMIDHRDILQKLNNFKLGAVARGKTAGAGEVSQESYIMVFLSTLRKTSGSNLVVMMTSLMVLAYFSTQDSAIRPKAPGSPAPLYAINPTKYYLVVAVLVSGVLDLAKRIMDAAAFSLDVKMLVLLASTGSLFSGQEEEGAAMIYLYSLSKLFEHATMNTVTTMINRVIYGEGGVADSVDETTVVLADTRAEVPLSQVKRGDKLLVFSGEGIPVDGVVTQHSGNVDESPVTGESLPQRKQKGSQVLSGTLLLDNALEIEATATPETSSSSRIMNMIDSTMSSKSKRIQQIDVMASVYTKLIIGIAVIFLIAGLVMQDKSVMHKALVLIVLGCPCALVMAGPIVTSCSIVGLAQRKVFVKDCEHLDILASMQRMCWDKTGTLTQGRFDIISQWHRPGMSARGVEMKAVVALQSLSTHPVSHSIEQSFHGCMTEAVEEHGVSLSMPEISDFKATPGKGLTGIEQHAQKRVFTGSQSYMESMNLTIAPGAAEFLTANAGRTLVLGAYNGEVVHVWCLGDCVREESEGAVRRLRGLGVQSVILSGDRRAAVEQIAKEVGTRQAWGELLPEQKVEKVQGWQREGEVVAMIGDGVNDAPALAVADTGLALCASGSTAYITTTTAPVVVATTDVSLIPSTVEYSRWSARVLSQNIFLSLAPKMFFLLVTLSGLVAAPIWVAVAIDFTCLAAVLLNGTRLLCF